MLNYLNLAVILFGVSKILAIILISYVCHFPTRSRNTSGGQAFGNLISKGTMYDTGTKTSAAPAAWSWLTFNPTIELYLKMLLSIM